MLESPMTAKEIEAGARELTGFLLIQESGRIRA
jgi:hypothetical protein